MNPFLPDNGIQRFVATNETWWCQFQASRVRLLHTSSLSPSRDEDTLIQEGTVDSTRVVASFAGRRLCCFIPKVPACLALRRPW
jgi:hypothetical protein